MGLVHSRLGPNKVSFFGLLQPLLDALKLLTKTISFSRFSNKYVYYVSPYVGLVLSLILWGMLPYFYSSFSVSFSLFSFMVLCSVSVFSVLMGGWASNSKYSFIGSIRSVAQSISYEAVFTTILLIFIIVGYSYSISSISYCWVLGYMYLFPFWLFSTIAETHRAPFDFSESESELVSGFNTEYSGSLFAFIFLTEYSTLLASCLLISWVFFPFICKTVFMAVFMALVVSLFITFIRVTYCRYRYDLLIISAWKFFLPVTLFIFLLYIWLL